MPIHITAPGESLHEIAISYAVSPGILTLINPNIQTPMLHPGEIVRLPVNDENKSDTQNKLLFTQHQFSDGILFVLSARLDDNNLQMSLYQINLSGYDITLNYNSGYRHDFIICDYVSRRLFKWSKDKCFGQFKSSRILKDGESCHFKATFPYADNLPSLMHIYAWDTADELDDRVVHLMFLR